MKLRKSKIVAFVATSAILLQAGGCGSIIFQLFAQQIVTKVLLRVVEGVRGTDSADTDTETDTTGTP